MSEIATKLVVNCETNESVAVPLTDEEIQAQQIAHQEWMAIVAEREAERIAAEQAKASAAAKLAALGLTEEEIKAITATA